MTAARRAQQVRSGTRRAWSAQLGIEEELLLFDPSSRAVVPAAPRVLKEFREHGHGRRRARAATDELDHELFRHQLETRTDPTRDSDDAFAQLVAARRTAGEAARAAGLAAGACGTVPLDGAQSVVTSNDRYRAMVELFGEVARTGGTCGMHVHVEIASDEEGVGGHRPDRAVAARSCWRSARTRRSSTGVTRATPPGAPRSGPAGRARGRPSRSARPRATAR